MEEIRRAFGDQVGSIIEACSGSDESPKPPWQVRNDAFVERLRTEPYSVRLVVAADKFHNVWDVLRKYRVHGDELRLHFKGPRVGTLWYYRAVVGALNDAATRTETKLNAIIEEIGDNLSMLEQAMAEESLRVRLADRVSLLGNSKERRGVSYARGRQRGLAGRGDSYASDPDPTPDRARDPSVVDCIAAVGKCGWRHHRRPASLRPCLS